MSRSTGQHQPTTIFAALREGRARLAGAGVDTPQLDAEVLLRFVLGIDRTKLFVQMNEPVDPARVTDYQRLLDSRVAGTPVAYLTGEREFMGLAFAVTPRVLIPRPETEVLVEWALRWLRARNRATVVDVGTGSGAIGLSVSFHMGAVWPGRVIATDVSADALATAARNRARLGLQVRVALRKCSLLDCIDEPVDLLLANLPYLSPTQIARNPELAAEPRLALDGGPDGLDLIRHLLADARRVMASAGAIGFEIDPSQRDIALSLAETAFPGARLGVLRDLAGLDRHITIEPPLL
jgi:release factor glutamine methyltransferase